MDNNIISKAKKEEFMKQIAILSDTHGLLREHVMAELAEADCSIHAGDLNTPYIIESMQKFGETYVDVVVYGHSHKYSAEIIKGVLFLNPGSCGKRRFNLEITMCRMTVEAGHYQYEKIMIPYDL